MSRALALGCLLLVTVSSSVYAQTPDFLFAKPRGTVAFRSGWFFARAGSDLFTFVEQQLTLARKDFNGPAVSFDVDMPVKGRLSAIAGFEYSGSSTDSEYRNFVDNNRLPITQTTSLRQVNLSYGVKLPLTPAGREISPHAWIPAAITPYIGAAGGGMWYNFHQDGDFVDFTDLSVFSTKFDSRGWAPSAHVFGGVDVKAWRRLYLNGEARYLWAHAKLSRSFAGFDPIDLTGLKVIAGIRYMF